MHSNVALGDGYKTVSARRHTQPTIARADHQTAVRTTHVPCPSPTNITSP